jgi:hypothetical protein
MFKGNLLSQVGVGLIVMILLISSFIFTSGSNYTESECDIESVEECMSLGVDGVDEFGSRGPRDDAHGGSWLDSFWEDSRIDWTMSDQIQLSEGDAFIAYSDYVHPDAIAFYRFNEGKGQ